MASSRECNSGGQQRMQRNILLLHCFDQPRKRLPPLSCIAANAWQTVGRSHRIGYRCIWRVARITANAIAIGCALSSCTVCQRRKFSPVPLSPTTRRPMPHVACRLRRQQSSVWAVSAATVPACRRRDIAFRVPQPAPRQSRVAAGVKTAPATNVQRSRRRLQERVDSSFGRRSRSTPSSRSRWTACRHLRASATLPTQHQFLVQTIGRSGAQTDLL